MPRVGPPEPRQIIGQPEREFNRYLARARHSGLVGRMRSATRQSRGVIGRVKYQGCLPADNFFPSQLVGGGAAHARNISCLDGPKDSQAVLESWPFFMRGRNWHSNSEVAPFAPPTHLSLPKLPL
jgi:hypothetical protein